MVESEYLLEVDYLVKHFPIRGGIFMRELGKVHALNGVSFNVRPGETLGVVGESGCGKSTMGRTVLRLYDPTAGKICFMGRDISTLSPRDLRVARKDSGRAFYNP